MRGARASTWPLLIGVFVLAGALRCAYAPNPASGTLPCSTTTPPECPEGYFCSATNYCYKKSEVDAGQTGGTGGATGGTGGSVGGQSGGAGGTGGKAAACSGTCMIKIEGTLKNSDALSADSKFVGHWLFQSGSLETVTCSDGSTQMNDLAAQSDFVDVTLTSGVLSGSYFCDWSLNVGPAGNATVIKAGQSCSRNVTDATTGTTKLTWHGMTFTLATPDGRTGTLASTVGVEYVDDASKTGCAP